MSFVGRWWRALDEEYDIVDSWPITFTVLSLSLVLSVPSLFYYSYGAGESAETDNFYDFHYSDHYNPLTSSTFSSLQLWRLFTSQLVWSSASEVILGTVLLLLIRPMEQRLTLTMWRSVLVLVLVMSGCIACGALIAAVGGGLYCASGPYWLCFFLLPLYLLFQSPTSHVKVGPLSLSNKVLGGVVGLQLMLFLIPQTLLAVTAPIVMAGLYALVLWCGEGGFERVTNPSRPQGMRVGRRGEATGHRVGPSVGSSGASTPDASRHAPRPASHYEKLIKNAKGGGEGGGGVKGSAGAAVSPTRRSTEMVDPGGGVRGSEPTSRPMPVSGGAPIHEVNNSREDTLVRTQTTQEPLNTTHS